MVKKRSGLGRGLNALIPETYDGSMDKKDGEGKIREIETKLIKTNPNQPRKSFDGAKIAALAGSIKRHGIMQPIIVEESGKGYRIIAGERRYRAAMEAELKSIPCLVRKVKSEEAMELALVENLQRENLNAIDEALAFRGLIEVNGLTQDKLAEIAGKSRPYIANSLRLLGLGRKLQERIEKGELTAGHGRALLGIEESKRSELADKIVVNGWSVRETEKRVKGMLQRKSAEKTASQSEMDPEIAVFEDFLRKRFATKVNIKSSATNKGKIEISYHGLDEFERIMSLLNK